MADELASDLPMRVAATPQCKRKIVETGSSPGAPAGICDRDRLRSRGGDSPEAAPEDGAVPHAGLLARASAVHPQRGAASDSDPGRTPIIAISLAVLGAPQTATRGGGVTHLVAPRRSRVRQNADWHGNDPRT